MKINNLLKAVRREIGTNSYKAKHLFLFYKSANLIKEISKKWKNLQSIEKYFFINNMNKEDINLFLKTVNVNLLRDERVDISETIMKKIPKKKSMIKINRDLEIKGIKEAIEQSKKCICKEEKAPKVGAVIIKNNNILISAYRGEKKPGDHAEYTAIKKVKEEYKDMDLKGAILITTLEPCTTRYHEKKPCAQHIVDEVFGKVIVGMIDPNPDIRGKGILYLQMKGIAVELFPEKYANDVIEISKKFINHFIKNNYKMSVMEVSSRERKDLRDALYRINDIKEVSKSTDSLTRLRKLNKFLMEVFDVENLQSLCVNLGLNWDEIRGDKLSIKATWLLVEVMKRGDVTFEEVLKVIKYLWPKYWEIWEKEYYD